MSVISVMEVTPNRIGILYRFLDAQSVTLTKESLLSFLSPASLARKPAVGDENPRHVANRVLSESESLGLIESGAEEGTFQVPSHMRGLDQLGLRTVLEKRLTHLDLAAAHGQDKVPHALAWFLNQSPAMPLAFRENQKEEIEADTAGRHLDLTNVQRFQQLSYWVQYLGLGWNQSLGNTGHALVADPTVALAVHLKAILAKDGEAPIRTVIETLSEHLPIMETGSARNDVEDWLAQEKRRDANDLSASTSLALLRLEHRGLIGLADRADAKKMRLLTWPDSKPVSHVVWKNTVVR